MNVDEAMAYWKQERTKDDMYYGMPETICDILSAEVERLRAELAAAKAASVCPVGWTDVRTNPGGNVVIYTENHRIAYQLIRWLRDRIKERNEG